MSMTALLIAGQLAAATLQAPMPEGFVMASRQAQGGQTMEERIPAGETLEAWTRMVTIQNFALPVPPRTLVDRVAAGFAAACPGSPPARIEDRVVAGRAEVRARISCTRNPLTGRPEVMFGRAVSGDGSLHMVQYAFRSEPTVAEAREAEAYLDSARLCPTAGCGRD